MLNQKLSEHNNAAFVANDPVCIPHRFALKQDREIAGFFAAIFAWGKRTTIIAKCNELMQLMDNAPYDFVMHHKEAHLARLEGFCHRTFCFDDLLYFIFFLRKHYSKFDSLEKAFTNWMQPGDDDVTNALTGFRNYFFSYDHLPRTRKHISTPAAGSACKRINMFLRWMVRTDDAGIDFGIWQELQPSQLVCPLDIHVGRVARQLGLLHRPTNDWTAAIELTRSLRELDAKDPVKYDLALFALGVLERYG